MTYKAILLCLFAVCAASLATAQAVGHSPDKGKKRSEPASASRKVEACSLLTNEEIEAIQGEAIKETKPGVQLSGGMVMSQCLFRTPTAAKSVSLEVATINSANSSPPAPRQFWRNQFHARDLKEKERRADARPAKGSAAELEKEDHKPRRISGVGEEAYWVSNGVTGVLYVLQGDVFLRISIGGIREESARIEKSKALASAAAARLRSGESIHHVDGNKQASRIKGSSPGE